ncbi:MAG: hypothetical protein INR70_40800 [Parafilimonas terrae]|nr:hypothetical protein [Parafilimonas terrae]
MGANTTGKRAFFSQAAREAAKAARQRKREQLEAFDRLSVFVTRDPDDDHTFRWEIRKFGGVLIERSLDTFATDRDARDAGKRTLGPLLPASGARLLVF